MAAKSFVQQQCEVIHMNEKNASAGPGAKEEGVGPVKDASGAPGLQNTGPVSAEENNPAPETGKGRKGLLVTLAPP